MCRFVVYIILLLPLSLCSQTLTFGDFFDIKEGDIFQTEFAIGTNLNAGPVEYQIDSVQKILYHSPDSIAWESRFTKFFRMPGWPAGTYSSPVRGTSVYTKGHLSDTVRHDPSWCTKIKDTFYMSDKYCDFLYPSLRVVRIILFVNLPQFMSRTAAGRLSLRHLLTPVQELPISATKGWCIFIKMVKNVVILFPNLKT
ncbi:MAG: hypothetical protein IPG18_15330 [Saprospiraceae bacterium]|nr:hypothetical protein [Saprospiraceae bacterium]